MLFRLPRASAGICVTVLVAGVAGAQSTSATASTTECVDSRSSPTASSAMCTPAPINGLSTLSGASATYTTSSAGGDVFGAQVSFRADDFAGAGGGTVDFLTVTGATPPSQVFVYFIAQVDGVAIGGNDNTHAVGAGEVNVAYNGGVSTIRRQATDDSWADPTITDTWSSNLALDGAVWRGTFGYAGPGASFGTSVGVFGELISQGGETPLAGTASGRALFQLLGFAFTDARGNAIADAACTFASGTACAIISVATTTAPEPSSALLLATGLLGVVALAWRGRPRMRR